MHSKPSDSFSRRESEGFFIFMNCKQLPRITRITPIKPDGGFYISAPSVSSAVKILFSSLICLAVCARAFGDDAPPRRIVCLAPSLDETLIELGCQDRIVGVTTTSDYLDEVKAAERVGSYVKPNVEKIAALKPDLVLASGFVGQQSAAQKLSTLGFRVAIIDDKQGIDEIIAKTRQIGDMAGAREKSETLVARMQKVIAEVGRKTSRLPSRPRVYVETGFDPLFTCGRGSFINDLIDIAGGTNIAAEINRTFAMVSSEFVLSKDPEVIILPYMGRNFGKDALKQRKGWENIAAVKTGRVYDDIGENAITIPSPRLILRGLPELLKRIHPEITEGIKSDPPRLSATPPKEGN